MCSVFVLPYSALVLQTCSNVNYCPVCRSSLVDHSIWSRLRYSATLLTRDCSSTDAAVARMWSSRICFLFAQNECACKIHSWPEFQAFISKYSSSTWASAVTNCIQKKQDFDVYEPKKNEDLMSLNLRRIWAMMPMNIVAMSQTPMMTIMCRMSAFDQIFEDSFSCQVNKFKSLQREEVIFDVSKNWEGNSCLNQHQLQELLLLPGDLGQDLPAGVLRQPHLGGVQPHPDVEEVWVDDKARVRDSQTSKFSSAI